MLKTIKGFFRFLASMNLAIFLLSTISLIIILQEVSDELITTVKYWKWLKIIASIDFYRSMEFFVLLIFSLKGLTAGNKGDDI